jgi:hypothetical protein
MPIITKRKSMPTLRTLLFAAALLTAAAAVGASVESSTMTHAQAIARTIILNAAKVITEHWPPYSGRFA